MGIMDKTGPLRHPADRDHSVQYIVAFGLINGTIDASDYEDAAAADPRIDALRAKITVSEDKRYSREFYDPKIRSSANAIQVTFKDGTRTPKIEVQFPLAIRSGSRMQVQCCVRNSSVVCLGDFLSIKSIRYSACAMIKPCSNKRRSMNSWMRCRSEETECESCLH